MADETSIQPTQPTSEASARETLSDILTRVPKYVQFSYRLVANGRMSASQQRNLLGASGLGAMPLRLVPGLGPLLFQATRILSLIGAIRYTLSQMQPGEAERQLAEVGLTREQVEADYQATTALAKRAKELGTKEAGQILEGGARTAGRLAGRGVRAFRGWQARNTSGPGDGPTS